MIDVTNFGNKLIFHPEFKKVVREINSANIRLDLPVQKFDSDSSYFNKAAKLVPLETNETFKLDAEAGLAFVKSVKDVCAYDESILVYPALEGKTYLTAHAIVNLIGDEYIPACLMVTKFYTRSAFIAKNNLYLMYSKDPDSDADKDKHIDRTEFMLNTLPTNSIIFIDGPLVGGQATEYVVKLNRALLKKNILAIFFVKNSNSNLVVDNVNELTSKYNSDLHWAHKVLGSGERTKLFLYKDLDSPSHSKIFCYIKSFNHSSPQRVEFHPETYEVFKDKFALIFNAIYYLMAAQGNINNPQIRPIAIAEKYAREAISLVNFLKVMEQINITPTMNQARGFMFG